MAYWNDHNRVCNCQQCRHAFTTVSLLGKNTMLDKVVEELKKMAVQTHPHHLAICRAEAGDVECNVCSGVKDKAVGSSLVCLASNC